MYFRVHAFGEGRELDLGQSSPVSWQHDAALVRDSACSDMRGTCAGSAAIRVHAASTGSAGITATLGRVAATREVTLVGAGG